jgi:hypothetical protein
LGISNIHFLGAISFELRPVRQHALCLLQTMIPHKGIASLRKGWGNKLTLPTPVWTFAAKHVPPKVIHENIVFDGLLELGTPRSNL